MQNGLSLQSIYVRISEFFPGMRIETEQAFEDRHTGAKYVAQISVTGEIESLPVRYLFEIVDENIKLNGPKVYEFAKVIKAAAGSKGLH